MTSSEFEYAEVARAESARGEIILRRRTSDDGPDVLELRANGVFVMDTVETSTEIELAAAALELVADPRDVLVGGLGLGFTLQRVLADVRVEAVSVVEVEEALIDWMRDGTIPHGPAVLADRRITLVNADIAMALAEARHTYDLVLLDVDNGPGHLVHDANSGLYDTRMIDQCRRILNADGALVVWAANPASELLATLERVFGNAEERHYDVLLEERPEQYYLYLARNRWE